MQQSPLLFGGPVELCATVPSTPARYTVSALRDCLRTEALALRELLVSHRLAGLGAGNLPGLAGRALTDAMPLYRLEAGLDAGICVMACAP